MVRGTRTPHTTAVEFLMLVPPGTCAWLLLEIDVGTAEPGRGEPRLRRTAVRWRHAVRTVGTWEPHAEWRHPGTAHGGRSAEGELERRERARGRLSRRERVVLVRASLSSRAKPSHWFDHVGPISSIRQWRPENFREG